MSSHYRVASRSLNRRPLRGAIFIALGEGGESVTANCLSGSQKFRTFTQTREVIRKFDRETGWVATAVLAMVIFGAAGLAILIKDPHLKVGDPDNAVAFFQGLEWTDGQSSGQITSVRLHDIDPALLKPPRQ